MDSFCNLTGKKALVTGASSGIGKAVAIELARGGADVVVHFARSESRAGEVVETIRELGQRAQLLQADLSRSAPHELVDKAWQLFGGIEIWINNAGVDLLTGPASDWPFEKKLEQLWRVDVEGTIYLSRLAAERMRVGAGGTILTIGWDQADRGMEGDSAQLFSAAKNAIMGFTRSLARSVAPEVRVNCIAPGWIQTAWGEQASEIWQERVIRETPLRRWGYPSDIAKLARFLVSDEANYLTGQIINANGGAVS